MPEPIMKNSMKKRFHHITLLLTLTIIALPFTSNPSLAAQTDYTPFSDDFDGPALDSARYLVQLNTNASGTPAWGGNIQVMNGRVFLSSNGTGFPCVTTASNPFPETGDFSIEFKMSYAQLRNLGAGFWITKGDFHIHDMTQWANVLQIWADDKEYGVFVIFLGNWTTLSPPPALELQGKDLVFRLDYVAGYYSLYLNGVMITQGYSDLRPDSFGFGHEPADYVPFGPPGSPGPLDNWCSFSVDYVHVLETSNISIATNTDSVPIGYPINFNGALTDENGDPLSGKTILISYAISGQQSWYEVSSLTSADDGSYSGAWLPTGTGNFTLKASWQGDEYHAGSQATVNVTVKQNLNEGAFYAESNSTLSSIYFNNTSNEIFFTVSGENGTAGYVRFLISKTIMPDVDALSVYMDGQQIACNVTSFSDSWQLYFSYHHSTHDIVIKMPSSDMPSPSSAFPKPLLFWVENAILAFMGILLVAVIIVAYRVLSRKK